MAATPGSSPLRDPSRNESTAITREERARLGLEGLLPHAVDSQALQVHRALENLGRKASDTERYIFLMALQERNERLFYRTLSDHLEELLPTVYTPTVEQACREFAHIFRHPRGLYLTPEDRGNVRRILRNWPHEDVRVVVVTDGERILDLGDLGANGMGIPIGKLSLYVAGGGLPPGQRMPAQLDGGTDTEELLSDPLYLGWPHPRIRGEAYLELIDEFVDGVEEVFPDAIFQFKDFLTPNAYTLLRRHRDRMPCSNDDNQGTVAVALGGVLAATRITGDRLRDLRVLFLGAGSAATGIADLMTRGLVKEGLDPAEARDRLWFVDTEGLVTKARDDLLPHNEPYVQDRPPMDFLEAIVLPVRWPGVLAGPPGHGPARPDHATRGARARCPASLLPAPRPPRRTRHHRHALMGRHRRVYSPSAREPAGCALGRRHGISRLGSASTPPSASRAKTARVSSASLAGTDAERWPRGAPAR